MLSSAGSNDGSLSSFLSSSASTANNFALISQNSVTNASSLVAQIASQNQKTADTKKLQDALASLSASQQAVQPKNVLDPIIFFADGSTIDTNSNILTMADGTQIDTTTGTKVIDTSSIIQMANGAYLDTKNNILTMSDGTKIDTVTGTEDLGDGLTVTEIGARICDLKNSHSCWRLRFNVGAVDIPPLCARRETFAFKVAHCGGIETHDFHVGPPRAGYFVAEGAR